MNDIIIKVGQKSDEWVLVSIRPNLGTFISTKTFNRWDDKFVEIEVTQENGAYTKVVPNQGNVPTEYFLDSVAPVSEVKNPLVSSVVYRHIRPLNYDNMRGVTLAVKLNYDLDTITYGYSICNGENFVKRMGRLIAKERLMRTPREIVFVDLETSLDTQGIVDFVLSDIAKMIQKL